MRRWHGIFLACWCVGCIGDDEVLPERPDFDADELAFRAQPSVSFSQTAPLSAVLSVETTQPARVVATLAGGASDETESRNDALATSHELPVLGFAPNAEHTLSVVATSGDGDEVRATVTATSPPLPAGFPPLSTQVLDAEQMEPGVTLFNVPGPTNTDPGYLAIVDADGDVVWVYESPSRPTDARRLANGNILTVLGDRFTTVEIDMLGNAVRTYYTTGRSDAAPAGAIELAVDSAHHDWSETADGNYVFLSSEHRVVADYPTSTSDPTPAEADVIGDVVVEITPGGDIVDTWSLLDLLDPTRIAYDSFANTFWASVYTDVESPLDWAHANAVIHDPADDTFIVSTRHQDAVFKFDRDGNVVWILGPADNWVAPHADKVLAGDASFEPNYHQHAPQITPSGTLMVFDNAVHRASPPADPLENTHSRAVEYAIDEPSLAVSQVWEYRGDHCRVVGDADVLPETGNVLVTFGSLAPETDGEPGARIVEVTRDDPAVEVWMLEVLARRVVYRAERLPSLYP